MKMVRKMGFALVLAVGVGSVTACAGSVETSPQTTASAVTKAPVGTTTHGFVRMIGEALGEVALRPDQRSELEKLAQEAEARHASLGSGRSELMAAVADQIEKGTIDRAALQPKIDKMKADADQVAPQDRAALVRVHAILDAEQRSSFVDALEKKFKEGRHHGHGAPGAEGPDHAHAGPQMAMGMRGMKQLAEDLKLTDAQRGQIKEAMKSRFHEAHAAAKEHGEHGKRPDMQKGRAVLEAFRGPQFDLDKLAPPAEHGPAFEGHMIGMAEKVVPILTPEQRKIAADKVRAFGKAPPTH